MDLFDVLFDSSFDKEGIFDDDLFDDELFTMGIDVPVDITPNKYGSLVQSLFEKKRKNEEDELMLILAGWLA